MSKLSSMKCEACKEGAKKLSDSEINDYIDKISDWELKDVEGVKRIVKSFSFDNFTDALAFTVKVGIAAEKEDHHPEIVTEWGKVTVKWWSHKIKGLHVNDFIMADRTDNLKD